MRRTWLPPLLAALFSFPVLAQQSPSAALAETSVNPGAAQPGALTLEQALSLALGRHPDVLAARSEVLAAEAARLSAGARPAPTVEFGQEDTRPETRSTTLQLARPFELGGKRKARLDVAERGHEAALARQSLRRTQLRAEVVAAFVDALVAQERLRLAEAALDIARSGSDAASRRVAAGKVSPIEETRARVALAGVRAEQAQARGELAAALRGLRALLGLPDPIERVVGDIVLPSAMSQQALLERVTRAPALRVAQLDAERLAAIARLERTRRVPDVTVGVGARRNGELGRTQALLTVSIPIPVADAWRGAELEALRRQDQARFEAEAAELRLRADASRAHERLQAALSEARTLSEEVLPDAQGAFDATVKGYELGKFGFLDVLDAQRTLLLSRTQSLRAIAQAHTAAAEIERLLGEETQPPPPVQP